MVLQFNHPMSLVSNLLLDAARIVLMGCYCSLLQGYAESCLEM